MKYRQLTKEQFLALSDEFAEFLATQQIDVKEWEIIKKDNPSLADEELNIFSDIVWEDVLNKTEFLVHNSEKHINLFKCNSKEIIRISIQLKGLNKNFLKSEDYQWFLKNPLHDGIDYFKAVKKYSKDRNKEIFELIEMGCELTKGDLFNEIKELIG
jgi:hypothetical protein